MTSGVEEEKVPPVPQHTPLRIGDPPVERRSLVSRPWADWFERVRAKINVINASVADLSGVTGGGYLARVGGNWLLREIRGADEQIVVDNGDGSGDTLINLSPTSVTPGSYTNTNLTVDQFGRIIAASNGSGGGGGGISSIQPGDGIDVDNTDPDNPIVSNTGVLELIAGDNITITPNGSGGFTIASTGGGVATPLWNLTGNTPNVFTTDVSQSVDIPATAGIGDLLIAYVLSRDVLTVPTGWNLAVTVTTASGPAQDISIYYKECEAGDPGATTIWAQASSNRISVGISSFSRSDGGGKNLIFTNSNAGNNPGGSAPYPCAGGVITQTGMLQICVYGLVNSSSSAGTMAAISIGSHLSIMSTASTTDQIRMACTWENPVQGVLAQPMGWTSGNLTSNPQQSIYALFGG